MFVFDPPGWQFPSVSSLYAKLSYAAAGCGDSCLPYRLESSVNLILTLSKEIG